MKTLVLGAGSMVEAILVGLKKTEDLSEWMIFSPSGTSAARLAGKVGARAVSDLQGISSPDWILVGCKPQQLKDLKSLIGDRFKDSLFVSLLAAVSEEDQLKILGASSLIRVMPNLPVEFNEGVLLLASSSAKERLGSFSGLFSKLGASPVVSEEELEELTILTGSGPALFYEFARGLAAAFTSLNDKEREVLVRQVLRGVARSTLNNPKDLTEMTEAVTSRGGVTIAVLNHWREKGFFDFLKKGIEAGKERAREITSLLRS